MQSINPKIKRPMLRYHGGKWMLAPWIISHFPKHKVYTEVFGGGGSILLRKTRTYAEVYNDLDEQVFNVFMIMRERGDELMEKLRLTPFSRKEFELAHLENPDPLEKARRTIIKSFMGFGSNAIHVPSGFRASSRNSGTAPSIDWKNYAAAIPLFIERLQGVTIENREAIKVLLQQDSPDTLHYINPPYVPDTRNTWKGYGCEMTVEDHIELAHTVRDLEGMVILSGYESELYSELYPHWKMIRRKALADGAKKRTEVLWLNDRASNNQKVTSLFS